jgi:hypothetical protein
MAIKSNRDGQCYDCGVEWKEGDMIDANGHKTKLGKDYWCKNGKNCQGVMTLQGSPNASDGTLDSLQREAQQALNQAEHQTKQELTKAKDLRKRFEALPIEERDTVEGFIMQKYIDTLDMCEKMRITDKPEIGMLYNNVMRRLQ